MGKDQDIKLNVEAKGAEKAAADVGKVDAAQKGLTEKTKEAAKPTEQLEGAQKKLNASTEDYTSLLSRIHPALGAVADAGVKSLRVLGDLGTRQIHLGQVFRQTTGAIRANAKALATLGAVGAVIAGIAAIAAAVRSMREEWDRATAAIKAHRDALNEIKKGQQELQQQIETVSDASRRGPFDAETSRRVAQQAERVRGRFGPAIDTGALGTVAGLLGPELSDEELAQATFLQQQGKLPLDPQMTADSMMRRFQLAMKSQGDRVRATMARELHQRAQRYPEARREGMAAGGSTVNIEDLIGEVLPAGADAKRMAELAQVYGTAEGLRQYEEGGVDPVTGRRTMRTKFDITNPFTGTKYGTGQERGTDVERAQLGILLQALEANTQATREATREAARGNGKGATNVYHNCRFPYPDSHTQRRATRNGENYSAFIGDG